MPLISIITPTFNSQQTIERTMKSVLSQDFLDYEYIIIDGKSTDKTCDIIKGYEPLFNGRLSWISEKDKGIYDAFNKGISKASGRYVWIVNSDDYMEPDALSHISKLITEQCGSKEYIISGALNFVSTDGKLLHTSKSNWENCQKMYHTGGMGITHPATIVSKVVYDRVGLYCDKFKIIGDIDWFHRAFAANEDFLFTDVVLTNMSDGGVSNLFDYKRSSKDRWLFLTRRYNNAFVRAYRFAKWTIYFYKLKWKSKRHGK